MKKRVLIIGIASLLMLIVVGMMFLPRNEKYVSYKEFHQLLEEEKLQSAEITDDAIYFYREGNNNQKYYTENPENDELKENMLLHNVKLENSFGMADVTNAFDILFYLIFIGMVAFGGYKLYSFTNANFKIIRNTDTHFSDIAGMEAIKRELMKVVDIVKEPKKYAEKGIRPPKGIILEGPPGNGKTLLARAIATEAKMNFIATKGADFQSAMMSIGPRKIKSLFKKARRNRPCIIFIDEFDGIGERRNYAGTGIDKENNRLIIAMLNEMDGFSNKDGVLVIAATNSYASLDEALIRPGRFDVKYRIDNPYL